jgi:DMSO/TMAO reductase YedYZ molybdopterin-dependent catalytic subunit
MLEGATVSALLTGALVAVWYFGWTLAGLPFAPFDLFDAVTRALPGPVMTFAIDTAVAAARGLQIADLSAAAKSAEQAVAIVGLVAACTLGASLMFAVLGLFAEPTLLLATILGAVLGALTVIAEQRLGRIAPGAIWSIVWTVGTVLAWAIAFGWIYDRLRGAPADLIDRADAARAAVDRRRLLLHLAYATGALTIAMTGSVLAIARRRVGVPGARWSDDHVLPNAAATVMPVSGTRPEFTPLQDHYRVDIDTRTPAIDVARWRLRLGGLVDRPLELSLDDLQRDESMHQFVTLSCISNPTGGNLIGTTRWTGVSLQRLVTRLMIQPRATHLRIMSSDGFFETVALDTVRRDARVMLTYAWDGVPLLVEHGFPIRLYVPGVYGMKQPKWITAIDAIDRWEPGYWVVRGWDAEGRVKTTSAIDVVSPAGIAGGIAHAGVRGISRVEVRIDDGDWRAAQLREPMSPTTWLIWRANLGAGPGEHVVSVRSYDGDGSVQTSGFDSKRMRPRRHEDG